MTAIAANRLARYRERVPAGARLARGGGGAMYMCPGMYMQLHMYMQLDIYMQFYIYMQWDMYMSLDIHLGRPG